MLWFAWKKIKGHRLLGYSEFFSVPRVNKFSKILIKEMRLEAAFCSWVRFFLLIYCVKNIFISGISLITCVCSEFYFWSLFSSVRGSGVSSKPVFWRILLPYKTPTCLNVIQIPSWAGSEIFFTFLFFIALVPNP